MTWMKRSPYLTILLISLATPGATTAQALAESAFVSANINNLVPLKVSLNFQVPDRGAPPATAGGATRGSACSSSAKVPIPLLPTGKLGLTVAERPSFFVYIPESSATTAEFLLLGKDDTEVVYQTTFTLPAKSGVTQFDLPGNAPALEVGKRYHWYVTLPCDTGSDASGNPTVEGWIERAELSAASTQELKQALPGDRPAIYAKSGIWHETLTSLADLRRRAPDSTTARSDWQKLLKDMGLEAIANEPLADCCTTTQNAQK